jgi:hypothetical protein
MAKRALQSAFASDLSPVRRVYLAGRFGRLLQRSTASKKLGDLAGLERNFGDHDWYVVGAAVASSFRS